MGRLPSLPSHKEMGMGKGAWEAVDSLRHMILAIRQKNETSTPKETLQYIIEEARSIGIAVLISYWRM